MHALGAHEDQARDLLGPQPRGRPGDDVPRPPGAGVHAEQRCPARHEVADDGHQFQHAVGAARGGDHPGAVDPDDAARLPRGDHVGVGVQAGRR